MGTCLFCRIRDGEIPAKILFQDEQCLAFEDIQAQAPFHCLVIPKVHLSTLNDVAPEHIAIMGHLISVGSRIAKEGGYTESGYRLVFNCNKDAGQSVFHIHLHVLAGRSMGWPPG